MSRSKNGSKHLSFQAGKGYSEGCWKRRDPATGHRHDYQIWRIYLHTVLPKLFRE